MELPGPAPGPATLDCTLPSEGSYACESADGQVTREGAFRNRADGFGELADQGCCSFLPFNWQRQ